MTILTRLANTVINGILGSYYQLAPHRNTASQAPSTDARRLHFFRGMFHFEPGAPFLNTLKEGNLYPRIFRFENEREHNYLRQWPRNTAAVIKHFISHPGAIGDQPIFVGHSSGGFTSFVLGAMAKGGDLDAIRRSLPGLEDLPLDAFQQLAANLRSGLYISIATPFTGVQLTRTGRVFNRIIVEPRDTHLIRSMTIPFVQDFYRDIGTRPEKIIDGNIVSNAAHLTPTQGLVSFAVNGLVQGGGCGFSRPFSITATSMTGSFRLKRPTSEDLRKLP